MVRRKDFTLIELLVVIAIIGIISSILLPTLSKARARAHQAVCLSNLKQLYYAFQFYANDWNDSLPIWGDDEVGAEGGL